MRCFGCFCALLNSAHADTYVCPDMTGMQTEKCAMAEGNRLELIFVIIALDRMISGSGRRKDG